MIDRIASCVTGLVLLSLAVGCAAGNEAAVRQEEEHWPTAGWETSAPEDQGMDPARLSKLVEHIEQERLAIDGLVVVRNGRIVLEKYPRPPYNKDVLHIVHSVTRSYGYQSWWTYPRDGVYDAAGLYGQRIYVIPDLDMVVVFTAQMPETSSLEPTLYGMVKDYIMAACE